MDEAIRHTTSRFGGLVKVARYLKVAKCTAMARAKHLGVDFYIAKPWTENELNTLKQEWANGLTGKEIGNLLGKSRCAILGKASRLGLAGRIEGRHPRSNTTNLVPPKDRLKRIRNRKMAATPSETDMRLTDPKKAKPPKFYPAARPITTKPPIAIGELTLETCRAIVGQGPDGLAVYCGDVIFPDKPFCEGHCAMYYRLPEPRRRAF